MRTVTLMGKLLARAAAAWLLCSLATAGMACDHPKGWKPSREELERQQSTFDRLQERASAQQTDQGPDLGATIPNPSACNADLSGMNLTGAGFANFEMSNADLAGADLSGARFIGDYMDGAILGTVKAIGTDFTDSDMTNAQLGGADLQNARLVGVHLDGARLKGTNLEGAVLEDVYLAGAYYEPRGGPPARISDLEGLESVTFRDSNGVAQLRQLARTTGQRDIERAASYAIEHDRTRRLVEHIDWPPELGMIEGLFRLVAFEWTTGYGLYPGRALQLIVMFLALLIPIYTWVAFSARSLRSRAAIYRVRPTDRIEVTDGKATVENPIEVERLSLPLGKAIAWGAYFSLLSAFNIGFRDFNVGNWINRTQPSKFQLESVGWVRTLSGIQSLLSLYLLAIWLLTYFGRPFD